MIKKLLAGLFATLLLASTFVSGDVKAQADDWTPVSSVGMRSANPGPGGYYDVSSGWFLEAAGQPKGPCFGSWGLDTNLAPGQQPQGGTSSCVSQSSPIDGTAFDEPPSDNPLGEIFTAGVTFSNTYFLSTANYNLPTAGSNAATRITSTFGYTTYMPSALSNTAQSDYRQHRVWAMGVFNGYMYIGTRSQKVSGTSLGAQIWRHDPYTVAELQNPTSANARWQRVVNNGHNSTNNEMISTIFSFDGVIYAGVYNDGTRARLLRSTTGANGTWSLLTNQFGSVGDYIRAGVVYDNRLYIATGSALYSSPDGIDWVNHSASISDPSNNVRALAVAGGNLYFGGVSKIYKFDGTTFSLSSSSITNVTTLVADENNRLFVGTGEDPISYQNSPRQARIWCLGCSTPLPETGDVVIKLPPKDVYTPEQLQFDGSTYTFSTTTEEFSGPSRFTITTETVGTAPLDSYEITIHNIERGEAAKLPGMYKVAMFNKLVNEFSAKAYAPPPATNVLLLSTFPVYDFKITFERTARQSTVANIADNLPIGYELASITDGDCGSGTSHICFKPAVELVNFSGTINGELNLQEVVQLTTPGQIVVEGNVLGAFEVGGFILPSGANQYWVAVGGNFTAQFNSQNDGRKLDNYVDGNAKLQWGSLSNPNSIASQLNELKDEGIDKATELTSSTFTTFNLNAPGTNPAAAGESSFTTGPGGKIWYRNGNLTLGSAGTNANIRGKGTLIVDGDITFANDVNCQNDTQFGVIATGSITFNSPTIDCGAYVSLGGNIVFSGNVGSSAVARGIFVTQGDIILPTVSQSAEYRIFYDASFAQEPSALFRDLLEIVFTTSS